MRFFPFVYKKNSLHIVQLFFIGGFGLLMFVFAVLFLSQITLAKQRWHNLKPNFMR
jgi:hypothetical protein